MRIYLLVLLFVFTTASCTRVQVQTEADLTLDFSGKKTFSWLETSEKPGDDVRINNPDLAVLVRAAIEKNLLKKGFVKSDKGDFLVNWLGAIEKKVRVESIEHFYSGYGYGTLAGSMPREVAQANPRTSYEEGTIVIDILDPDKHILLWRGTGKNRLKKGMDKAQVASYVNLSVSEILKGFPVSSD